MNDTPKNREWVKNAAIIFLAVILVLTFFSNTIMNRSLPEVATQNVTDGAIVAKVRGSGTVVANGNNQVKMEKTRVIRSVLVKAGQEVQAGDILFTLGEGSSEEIEAAEEKVRNLQNSYNRAAVSGSVYDYTTDERKIDILANKLEDAEIALMYAEEAARSAAPFAEQIAEVEKELAEAIKVRDEAKKEYDDALRKQKEYDAELQRLKEEQENIVKALVENNDIDGDLLDGTNNNRDIISFQLSRERYGSSTSPATGESEAGENPDDVVEEEAAEVIEEPPSEGDRDNNSESSQESPGESSGTSTSADAESGGTSDSNTAVDETESIAADEGKIERLEKALEDYDNYQSQIYLKEKDAGVVAAKAAYDAAVDEAENLSIQLDILLTTGSAEGAVYKSKLDAYNTALDNYNTAVETLNLKRANDWQSQAAKGVDLNATKQELEVAKAKLAELTGTEDGEPITARVSGTVTSVECNAGDKKMKDDVLCTIEVPDQGYTLSFSVTNEQASRLRIGDQATVSNFYWGNEVTATLSSIKTDPKNAQNNKLLTFDLEGNVTSGSQLTISVGSKSANYDIIIPSSAIRSDSNGSFVYKVDAKSSPLGNRYIAKRVPVEVLANDDNNSAVTAELDYGDYVITTSSAPIKNGSMVRLANA